MRCARGWGAATAECRGAARARGNVSANTRAAATRALPPRAPRSSSEADQASIAGEEMPPLPLPPPRASLASLGDGGGGAPLRSSSRQCALFPPLPPLLAWLALPPWVCPPSEAPPEPAAAPAGAAADAARAAALPQFAELDPPLQGWLEVVRAPLSSTTLDLSPASGAKGRATDATLLESSKRACGSLLHLDVTACPAVTPAALLAVCQANPRLQLVRAARGAPWGPGPVTHVLNACPELLAFEVDCACRRVDETVAALLSSSTLRLRQLSALGKVSAVQLKEHIEPLLPTSSLRRLVLANANCGPEGAKALARVLRGGPDAPAPQLRQLNVSNCGIEAAGGKALAEALRANATLRVLHVGQNILGDEGAIALARALGRDNRTLKQLWLQRNSIGPDAAREIATMLQTNSSLEVLNLADNALGAAGGKLLAGALRRNRAVQQFFAPGNRLGDAAGKEFLATMRDSKSLWKVELHNNDMKDILGRELAVLSLQALLRGDPRFDSEEDEAFGEPPEDPDAAAAGAEDPDAESAHASDSSGSEDGESEDSASELDDPADAAAMK